MGTATSVTAFPVLARILKERNLLKTSLGTVAISSAAIDDIRAWLLLAVLTAMVHSAQSWTHFVLILFLLVIFIAIMLVPLRRIVGLVKPIYGSRGAGVELISIIYPDQPRGQLEYGTLGCACPL